MTITIGSDEDTLGTVTATKRGFTYTGNQDTLEPLVRKYGEILDEKSNGEEFDAEDVLDLMVERMNGRTWATEVK